jgi:uncharacterized protein GlcG (DUF336 family)
MWLAGGALIGLTATLPRCFGDSPAVAQNWTADNGNGTYSNPLFIEEFEDPDVIRVGEDYYLAGTTMHMNPAVQLMHSKDLVNWELVGYCMDRLDFGPAFRLEGRNVYGRGIWAPCIRFHQGMFYVFSNVNGVGLQVFRSKSIHGPWERNQLPGRHDLSVLFDDDGKVYIISGGSSPYPIEELTPDLTAFVRMDDARGGSVATAIKKAKTACFFGMPTGEIGKLSQPGGPLYGIEHSNGGLITFPGGVPIVSQEGILLGAIGVSGSSVENDDLVAMAGVAVIGVSVLPAHPWRT